MRCREGLLLVLLLGTAALPARAASFACAAAATPVERRICADPLLSALDEKLAVAYAAARRRTDDVTALREWQRYWLLSRPATTEALRETYSAQIAELHALATATALAPISGRFERYRDGQPDRRDGAGLTLLALGAQRVRVIGNAVWQSGDDPPMVNGGEIAAVGDYDEASARLTVTAADNPQCQLIVRWEADALQVTDVAEGCGGLNVSFGGEYRRQADTTPR